MHFKKVILAIISVAYTLVLVHNLTPHRHNHLNKELDFKTSPLNNWFNFIFGSEHESSVQGEDHLTKFLLSENDLSDELSCFLQSDETESLFSFTSVFFCSYFSSNLSQQAEDIFLSADKNLIELHLPAQITGRAPPVLTII